MEQFVFRIFFQCFAFRNARAIFLQTFTSISRFSVEEGQEEYNSALAEKSGEQKKIGMLWVTQTGLPELTGDRLCSFAREIIEWRTSLRTVFHCLLCDEGERITNEKRLHCATKPVSSKLSEKDERGNVCYPEKNVFLSDLPSSRRK